MYIKQWFDVTAEVKNVKIKDLTKTSVNVSWDLHDHNSEITNYLVHYQKVDGKNGSESTVKVHATNNSVVIDDLVDGGDYQFEVVAQANLGGPLIKGPRSATKTIKVVGNRANRKYVVISVII